MKKLLIAVLAASFALASTTVALGDDIQEQKVIEVPRDGNGWIGVDFEDVSYDGTSLLTAVNERRDDNINDWRTVLCESVADPKCQLPGYLFDVRSMFSPCTATILVNCIESVKATLPSGEVINGVPGKLWNPNGIYKGDDLLGIPDGGQPSSWTLKGSNPGGSEDYVLIAGVQGQMRIPEMTTQQNNNNFFWGNPFTYFQPVTYVSGKYDDPKMTLYPRGTTGIGIGGGLSNHRGCFMNDTTQCALRASFPLDVRYSITYRFNVKINSWIRGRLVEPIITTEGSGNKLSTMTISAKPMLVPEVAGYIKWSDAPQWLKDKYPAGSGGVGGSPDAFTTQDLEHRILRVGAGTSGWRAINEFKDWIPFLKDKPMAMKSYWNIDNVQFPPDSKMSQCAREKFAGVVSSNAAVYSSGAPEWNSEKYSLDYTVGAPHYDVQGNVFKGQYYLAIKSDVARCLYGFSNAPISAKVEIASEDGTPEVATTVVNEDKSSGFLTLSAYGFHFSTPKISAVITQAEEKPVAVAPVKPQLKTIVCAKGKLKKTVKGTSVKCPTGFKKVA